MSNESESVRKLRSITDRIINLEEQKASIAEDIKDVYAEAKATGFSPAAIRKVVKRRLETPEAKAKREEVEALTDLYAANLGMLGGTPLGDAARRRMMQAKPNRHDPPDDPDMIAPTPDAEPDAPPEPEQITPETLGEARQRGRDDHQAGKDILQNPYVSTDPRRAAWDEGWCEADGSDGMGIPDHLRPKKKQKSAPAPDAEKQGDDGAEGGEG